MNQDRIDEIRKSVKTLKTWGVTCVDVFAMMDSVPDLLAALEEARAENERLKDALVQLEERHISFERSTNAPRGYYFCDVCLALQNPPERSHADHCPFAILEKVRE